MKILLAIDGSPSSNAAVEEVASRPWPSSSEVRIITVDPPVDPGLFRGGPSTALDEVVTQQRAEAEKFLLDAAELLIERSPDVLVTTLLLEGRPEDTIVAEAERWGADLVVVGSHGKGPIGRLLLGSVSRYVANRAPCSVQIVREPAHAIANPPGP